MEDEADIITALVTLLKADANTAAMATGGIFGTELPKDAVERMPLNAIVVQPSGGVPLTPDSNAALDAQRVDIMAYGITPLQANQLRIKARKELLKAQRKVVGGVLIHWTKVAGGFFFARERDGLWPQSFQSFQVFYSTQEVQP